MKRSALIASAMVLVLLSACNKQTASSLPVSVSEVEGSSAPESTVQPVMATGDIPETNPIEDGRLRVLYRSEENVSIVFCGSEVIFRGKGLSQAFEREDGTQFFSAVSDESEQHYTYALYDADSTLLLDDLPAAPSTLIGKWLFCTPDWYSEQDGCVVDLDTMEQIPFSGNTAPFRIGEDYFGISTYASEDCVAIYTIADLSLVEDFPGYWGYTESDLPGFVSLHSYEAETGRNTSLLYSPETGKTYEHFERSCGEGLALLQTEDGFYTVVDITTDETLYTGDEEGNYYYQYYSDPVKVWLGPDQYYVSAPCYSDAEPIIYANFPWREGDDCIDIARLDGGHDILNEDGELVVSMKPAEGNEVYYLGYNCLIEHDASWEKSGVTLYKSDGTSVSLERYQSLDWFQNTGALLAGNYRIGNTYLMDILDTDGNLLIEGLNESYSYVPDPAGILLARKGFSYGILDMEGNWLWKESIFQTTEGDAGSYY